ncbi:GNAT family N-acetyltransferase [Vibrio sonorensis]|uniref:GNAT family N-acetyltransferase n=1 Tax=Vibrio sonorensis TaxID=1004316 RepID=UPI0008DA0D8A|nr:GNAT family N-acetyltransferase [Vibrio sonorensis]
MIRTATVSDLEPLIELLCIENQHNASLASDTICETVDVLTHQELEEILADSSQQLFVWESVNTIHGALLGNLVRVNRHRWTQKRCFGYVQELVVHPKARRKGIAKLLVDAFSKWALEHQATHIDLHVWANNEQAIGFYEKYGFNTKQLLLSKAVISIESKQR